MVSHEWGKCLFPIPSFQMEGFSLRAVLASWKDPDAGKDWGQAGKEATEDEMVGWHHWLHGHELEKAQGDSEGQGSLVCCSWWGRKKLDTTEWLNWTELSLSKNLSPPPWNDEESYLIVNLEVGTGFAWPCPALPSLSHVLAHREHSSPATPPF